MKYGAKMADAQKSKKKGAEGSNLLGPNPDFKHTAS